MKSYAILFCLFFFAGPLLSQTKSDVTACLRACLQAPELEAAFTQEWGALRPLYLRKRETPGLGSRPVDEAINQLAAEDFQGLPWEVIPATREEAFNLPSEEAGYGILESGLGFREEHATVSLFITLPRYPRQWMAASFLLGKESGQWAVLEKSVEIYP